MSVDDEEEARLLLVFTCSRNLEGEFVARELEKEQTLENLEKFGQRLADAYAVMKRKPRRKRK